MLQSLTELQRDCLAVLKHCCAVLLGPHGDVKGAYLKMALFWECEEASPDTWEAAGLRTMALRVLSRLQEFARLGRLPCYFWSEINMLATRTDTELARLDRAAQCIKVHLLTATAALVALFVRYDDSGVSDPRLPRRRWDLLWEFVLQRAQPVRPEDPLLTETWLKKDNFSMLMGKSSSMNAVYERVLESLVTSGSVSPTGVGEELTDDWLAEE
ncbi:hypothetical protein FJT64_016466 [Amphibalanus amphitrite]|uniref:Mab-21-like HhH/H2TH-like domain-containing protein n=1 Tax=Amphibalanus amphitrite TaxID=1232801 RepID=A0A6A4XCM7_AMPAM|nr:hypothetical protein FJT64_016466 [Amphibalanus amphitrite]